MKNEEYSSYEIRRNSFALYETVEETVVRAIELAKDIHGVFGNDIDILGQMAEKSIIGYAYLQACRSWNCSWVYVGMVPSTLCVLETLRRILLRIRWRSAEDAAEAQEYLDAVVSEIRKRDRDYNFSFKISNYAKVA